MQKTFLFFILMISSYAFAQCDSLRYTKPIFGTVTKVSQIKYGAADPYGLVSSQDLYLDFYEPFGDTLAQRPLIVYAFGGGFLIGDKNQPPIPAYCEYFAKCGYAVVAIDYRIGFNTLSTQSAERAVYRAAQDLRAAVRFIAQRAATYRIDTSAIILAGSSAGCFSGLHSTYMDESQKPASSTGITLEPEDLGCFDCSTNADNNRHLPKPRAIINNWGAVIDTNFIVNTPAKATPVISFHGNNDNAVPYNVGYPFSYPVFPTVYGSNPIHKRLTNVGIKNKLVTLYGEGHEPWLLNNSLLDTAYKYTLPFLYEVLQPAKPLISGSFTACEGDTLVFSVNPHGGSKYCWTVSGATLLEDNHYQIKVKAASPGSFWISVKETDYLEFVSQTATATVTVVARPVAHFGLSANELAVVLTDSSVNVNSTSANMGDGHTFSTFSQPYSYAAPGTYTITLTATNSGCSVSHTKAITVDTCPRPTFSYTVQGNVVTFTAQSGNSVSNTWLFGDGDSATNINTVQHTYSPGTYLVGLWQTNALGCRKSSSQLISIVVGGINDYDTNYSVYPVPATDWLFFNGEKCDAVLYSIDGKKLKEVDWSDKIDVRDLPADMYLLQLHFQHGERRFIKIVIE